MTPENFAYYLQGFIELTDVPGAAPTPPTSAQWTVIRRALATVFEKVTPPVEAPTEPLSAPLIRSTAEAIQDFQHQLAATQRLAQRAARDASGNRRIC